MSDKYTAELLLNIITTLARNGLIEEAAWKEDVEKLSNAIAHIELVEKAAPATNEAMSPTKYYGPSQEKFLEVAKPLIEYLANNYHPHVKCIVHGTGAELLEGQMTVRTYDFLRD